MADESTLNKHLATFQRAAHKLEYAVIKSEIEWNDAQFYNLRNSVKNVAADSRQVLLIGGRCISAIKRFNAIESER